MMANTGNREVELFSLSWEWPSEGTVLSVVGGGMYPGGQIACSMLTANLNLGTLFFSFCFLR